MERTFPIYFKCKSKAEWVGLNNLANNKLGYKSNGADTYSEPIIDTEGKHYFIVNPEAEDLLSEVQLNSCVNYELITLQA
jgi:hypothetical protein